MENLLEDLFISDFLRQSAIYQATVKGFTVFFEASIIFSGFTIISKKAWMQKKKKKSGVIFQFFCIRMSNYLGFLSSQTLIESQKVMIEKSNF